MDDIVSKYLNEEKLVYPSLKEKIDNYGNRAFVRADELGPGEDSLVCSFSDLDMILQRHCYNKVAAAAFLGKLKKSLKRVENKLRRLEKTAYREFTDKLLVQTPGKPGDKPKNPVGLQKMDAEYRSSEVYKDPQYLELQKEEEELIELVCVAQGIYDALNDRARFLLGMQKTMNQS